MNIKGFGLYNIIIMGIPSFFSHIVKNHRTIIKKITELEKMNNLYLDSNSIIYDCLRSIEYDTDMKFEKKLLKAICSKIDEYINVIEPDHTILIAFDGVAPVAKLEQQRTRRYKSDLEGKIRKQLNPDSKKSWDTRAITPGTKFMKKLNSYVKKYYHNKEKLYNVDKIIVSGPNEKGEGEHKIFDHIRKYESQHKKQRTIIYGLDADLIMLALNNLPVAKWIYLYRETPEFIKYIDKNLIPNESYVMDIPELSQTIIKEMNGGLPPNTTQQKNKLYDYILLCFFLGNDFMPHFPSINIRKDGIFKLMAAYRNTIGKKKNLTDGKKIYWDNLYHLIEYLAKEEWGNIKKEYNNRNKLEKRFLPAGTYDEQMERYLHTPTRCRELEHYINPLESFWEKRYYDVLFDSNDTLAFKRKVSTNFLEGLEWVMKYYTTGCYDWKWCYRFNYPPLLKDLLKFIPRWDINMLEYNDKAVSPEVQLAYVLPKDSLKLLPTKIYVKLLKEKSHLYKDDCELVWAYCKYIWESHVNLPHIDINDLEEFVENNK